MLDFSTSWIGATGLGVEVVGLGLLFFDLVRTKRTDRGAEALSAFRESLESGGRDLIIRLHGSFATMMDAMAKLMLLDMDKAIPIDFREALAKAFASANAALPSTGEIREMLAGELVAKASIAKSFQKQKEQFDKLRWFVMAGIFLVLLGASLQLLDLLLV